MVKSLDPKSIPKYVNQLFIPPVYMPTILRQPNTGQVIGHEYKINVSEFQQQLLPPGFGTTKVYGYGGMIQDQNTGSAVYFRSAPGPTFEAIRGIPVYVQWINNLTGPLFLPVDPTLDWANPNSMAIPRPPFPSFPPGFPLAQKPVPIVTHLHGGETPSYFDGNPDAWFTADGRTGMAFITDKYTYLNVQQPTTLWYHDHTMGINRLTLYAGLAGGYVLRDMNDPIASFLPGRENEIPLIIQDRSFNTDGSLFYEQVGVNPSIHPYWVPEFFGNTITVNGKVWPNLNVKPQQYRFRLVNGSNARFYDLKLSNQQKFIQIGSDGGYLPQPVELSSLLISPAERADILIDFSTLTPGTTVILMNNANAPFPGGTPADPQTVGQIMQFTVTNETVLPPKKLPPILNNMPQLKPTINRTLTLFELEGPNGPLAVTLDGQMMRNPVSELPRAGTTEDWQVVNLTDDTHPIHLHLVQYQLVSRHKVRSDDYLRDWKKLNQTTPPGTPPYFIKPKVLPIGPYLQGQCIAPPLNEKGWKDTIQMNPGEVTTIRVRFASQDGRPYQFDPSLGPGYVWHCHILEHAGNEMMRPYKVLP
ncbi:MULTISPECIES: multicopper oxidase family protein [Bacillaceae]|uniref:multicopper oxidase family protein n=1 Tax=Bacillaceae TaxID=186817 RepID=UPI000C792D68|nr:MULTISPECIES: multicopper oxidase [Bacillaceae]PLR68688.1 copper oxidase [Bacillus sp. UMB0893]